jgi:hypothetical protein
LVGTAAMGLWGAESFYVPDVNSVPLSDDNPDAAPALNELRVRLQDLVGRPVNFQASAEWFLTMREGLLGQPNYTLLET